MKEGGGPVEEGFFLLVFPHFGHGKEQASFLLFCPPKEKGAPTADRDETGADVCFFSPLFDRGLFRRK